MQRLTAMLRATVHTLRDERGQDLLEYALLAALISVFAAGAVTTLGSQINNVLWQTIASNF